MHCSCTLQCPHVLALFANSSIQCWGIFLVFPTLSWDGSYPAPGWRAMARGSSRPSSIKTDIVTPARSETEIVSVPERIKYQDRKMSGVLHTTYLCLSSRGGCTPSPRPARQPSPRWRPPAPSARGSRSLSGLWIQTFLFIFSLRKPASFQDFMYLISPIHFSPKVRIFKANKYMAHFTK